MKRGTPRHRKMRDLAGRLGIPLYSAVGIMEMLWEYAGQQTPEGDIGIASDEEIAGAVGWQKKPSILIEALIESRWLDRDKKYRLLIHDWPDHCEQAVVKFLEYNGRDFVPPYKRSVKDRKRGRKSPEQDYFLDIQTEEKKYPRGGLGLVSFSQTENSNNETPSNGNPPKLPPPEFDFAAFVAARLAAHPNKKRPQIGVQMLANKEWIFDSLAREQFTTDHDAWCQTDLWRWKQGANCPTFGEFVADYEISYRGQKPPSEVASSSKTKSKLEQILEEVH